MKTTSFRRHHQPTDSGQTQGPTTRPRPNGCRSTERASVGLLPAPPAPPSPSSSSSRDALGHTATPPRRGRPPRPPRRTQAPHSESHRLGLPHSATPPHHGEEGAGSRQRSKTGGKLPRAASASRCGGSQSAAPRLTAGKRPSNFPGRAQEPDGPPQRGLRRSPAKRERLPRPREHPYLPRWWWCRPSPPPPHPPGAQAPRPRRVPSTSRSAPSPPRSLPRLGGSASRRSAAGLGC